ncbi:MULTISPECIES: ABC transporter substrate-binding protein [unclassified Zymobacter]|uniref:ABC transporter substrate-binding protein n=1 Tax=unclassified Zymobacter TaxID=3048685 RepID=UPI0039C3D70C
MKRTAMLTGLLMLATTQSQAALVSDGELTIGSDLTYPPYNYLKDNEPAGFDVEVMALIAQQMSLTPRIKDTRFASLIMGLKSHKFDVVASTLYVTPERAQQVAFIPYMKTGGALMVKAGSTDAPQRPEDLCGKRVGSIKGGAWIPKLRALSESYCAPHQLGAIDVKEFPSSPEVTQALFAGAIDVEYENAAVAKATVDKTGQRMKITSTSLLYPVVVGLAVNKNDTALHEQLETALSKVSTTPEYAALLDKYNVQVPAKTDFQRALDGTL